MATTAPPQPDFANTLTRTLAVIVLPLSAAQFDRALQVRLFGALNWDIESIDGLTFERMAAAIDPIRKAVRATLETAEVVVTSFEDVAQVLGTAAQVLALVNDFGRSTSFVPVRFSGTQRQRWEGIGVPLLNSLSAIFVSRQWPAVFHGLRAMTLVDAGLEFAPFPGTGPGDLSIADEPAIGYVRFRPDRLTKLVSNPLDTLRQAYGLQNGLPDEAAARTAAQLLIGRIGPLIGSFGVAYCAGDENGNDLVFAGRTLDRERTFAFRFLPYQNSSKFSFGAAVSLLSDQDGGAGLVVAPFIETAINWLIGKWLLTLKVEGSPPSFAVRASGVDLAGLDTSAVIRVSLSGATGSGAPPIIGIPGGTRFELGASQFAAFVKVGTKGWDTGASAKFRRSAIVVEGNDGFLKQILPPGGVRCNFDLDVAWSHIGGLQLSGGAMLEVAIPLHINLGGVVALEQAFVSVRTNASGSAVGLTGYVAVSPKITLGPIKAAVDRIGVQALLSFPQTGGNLGMANLELRFKPPAGAQLLVDASAVKGGGALFFNYEQQRYSGAMQLTVKNAISLKVLGVIEAKLPDGSPGYSLILIVTADFPPIQLGYGFTLNGVGGLAAFNRTMNVDALRDGIKNHTLDSILFPPDPVANASKVISDLESVFPAASGRFVFAPMVKIAWGKSILLIEIGLAVELPSPLRLAIMGKVHLLLPPTDEQGKGKPDKAVEIHLDVLGILDLDRNEISVDAVLYDSRLAIFPITGGMALRIKWGPDPVFLLAIGGFNPRFAPPPGFPVLDRVGIQLSYDKDGLRAGLLLTSYVAVTSSTVQFGARIDAYAEVAIAKIAGYLGFDALVEMAPFHIIVDVYGGVTVRAFGFGFSCDLLLTLAAFDPVTGDGHLTIDFLGKHEVPIHFAIGNAKPLPALPVADPLAELVTALKDLRSWSAALPLGGEMLVTLRQPTADEIKTNNGQVMAHPLGELSVRQRVLPFDVVIDRFGAAVPSSSGPFSISEVAFGGQAATTPDAKAKLRDSFARGQFVSLSEDNKLTGPQFESFVNGYARLGADLALGDEQVRLVSPQTVAFEYDVVVIDSLADQSRRPMPAVPLSYGALLRSTQFSASKLASVELGGPARFDGTSKGISVAPPSYKEVSVDEVEPNEQTEFDTWTQADSRRRMRAGPSRRQVVESHEFA